MLPVLLHELLHYIPALIFGKSPKLARNWLSVESRWIGFWRDTIVLICPALVGIIATVLAWQWQSPHMLDPGAPGAFARWYVGCWFAWFGLLVGDIADLLRAIFGGKEDKKIIQVQESKE